MASSVFITLAPPRMEARPPKAPFLPSYNQLPGEAGTPRGPFPCQTFDGTNLRSKGRCPGDPSMPNGGKMVWGTFPHSLDPPWSLWLHTDVTGREQDYDCHSPSANTAAEPDSRDPESCKLFQAVGACRWFLTHPPGRLKSLKLLFQKLTFLFNLLKLHFYALRQVIS